MALPILKLKEENIRDEIRAGAHAEADYIRTSLFATDIVAPERPRPQLRIVPPRQRAIRVGSVVFAALFLTLLCITIFQTQLAERQIGVERINREIEIARERFDTLRKENARLSSPDVITAEAEALGMSQGTPQKAVATDADAVAEATASLGAWGATNNGVDANDPLAEHKRIKQATDAEAGLVLAREQQPELILMDIQLPGIDGFEATTRLKRDPATSHIPVIALTALAMKGDEERIRAAGCDGYIAKPVRYRELLAAIASQLAKA